MESSITLTCDSKCFHFHSIEQSVEIMYYFDYLVTSTYMFNHFFQGCHQLCQSLVRMSQAIRVKDKGVVWEYYKTVPYIWLNSCHEYWTYWLQCLRVCTQRDQLCSFHHMIKKSMNEMAQTTILQLLFCSLLGLLGLPTWPRLCFCEDVPKQLCWGCGDENVSRRQHAGGHEVLWR